MSPAEISLTTDSTRRSCAKYSPSGGSTLRSDLVNEVCFFRANFVLEGVLRKRSIKVTVLDCPKYHDVRFCDTCWAKWPSYTITEATPA